MNTKSEIHQVKLGFSLIELSVVILVIGILVLGISKGSRIISEARVKSAQSLTNSSPVSVIGNTVLWLESSTKNSFDSTIRDGDNIPIWYDLSNSTVKNNATESDVYYQPVYTKNAINGLPAVMFNVDIMDFDGTALANKPYSIFVVEQRMSSSDYKYYLGTRASNPTNGAIYMGYRDSTTLRFGQIGINDYNITVPNYSTPITRINSLIANTNGRYHYINGVASTISAVNTSDSSLFLESFNQAIIGAHVNTRFYGYIAEIIIFNKALGISERRSIELYLSAKWGVKLS